MKFRNILLASVAVLFCTASISAQLSHTWVSGSGSNTNPCTFASPCATFFGALSSTYAGGLITAKDAGDFGPVYIYKPVTIDGANLGSITFDNSGYGAGVEIATGGNVTLQNLTINGLSSGLFGIQSASGGMVTVDNCKIMNFLIDGIYFYGAGTLTVQNSRINSFINSEDIGIEIGGNAAENVFVKNTVIDASPAANYAIGFEVDNGVGPVMAALQNVSILGAGDTAVWTGVGDTQISDSVLTQSGNAVQANHGSTISVASSLITANGTGVCSGAGSKIRLDNNDIYDNTTAIGNCSGIVKTSTTNKTSGTISIPAADVSESVTF
jgi:hypothetical protein